MNQTVNRDKWFLCRKPKAGAAIRLFCFPFGGGGASVFRSWPEAMGDNIEVRALQLPGREARFRDALVDSIEALTRDVVDALAAYQDKPYAIFGYSLGSLLAFEVSRELRRRGMRMPRHLFIGAAQAPQREPPHPAITTLSDADFIQKCEEYYQPEGEAWNNAELRELFLPVLKADIALCENYDYYQEEPLDCAVDVFAGDDDRATPLLETRYWTEQTTEKIGHHVFAGGHFFIDHSEPEIQRIVLNLLTRKL